MALNSTSIYTGYWIDWSNGRVLGSTITLSAVNGAILTSFIATFVALVGTQLWKILCFVFHQIRVTEKPRDGLYHQHQNVLRNVHAPGEASLSFMLQSWHWWGRTRHSLIRSLPWALFSIFYLVVFTILAIFGSSEVTRAAGQERLIRSSQCGYWMTDESATRSRSFEVKTLRDLTNAAAYARECYGESANALQCNTYATPSIRWEGKNVGCAFKEGMCWRNHTYQMDTGLIDSHFDLGINTPQQERLKYRRVTTCSVIGEEGYINDSNDTMVTTWNYGPTEGSNFTINYNKNSLRSEAAYSVHTIYATAGTDSMWIPIEPLNRTDADISLVWIAPNSILYREPVDDPIFSAHLVKQHQICNADNCTPLSGRHQVFSDYRGLSTVQKGILERLGFATIFVPITAAINGRGFSALRASETLQNLIQTSLPPNQWEIEVSSWFSTGLASLQNTVQDYVNPRNIVPGISVGEPQTTVDIAMCSNQKTEFTNGTISFSVLGIAVILVVGMLIVLTSFFLAPIVGYLGFKSYHSWVLDDTLQLQRMVFETRGVRWTGYDRGVPVTETPERFPAVASSAESQALMADHRDEKMVGTNVIQIREEVA